MSGNDAGTLPPVVRAGTSPRAPFMLEVTPRAAGWAFSGIRVIELAAAGELEFETAEEEFAVLPLAGSCTVRTQEAQFTLAGRANVFAGPSDFAYVPRESTLTLESSSGGRFALVSARAQRRFPACYVAAGDVPVELRGAGSISREVRNFCAPEVVAADRLIAVEVLTPGGNWSSYPPHKHDTESPEESVLEEIYYFEVADDGPAYQRVYASSPDRDIDICAEVRTGDVVLIPYGYHGPSMATPGYDLYYLNVMAGPGERVWRICLDPAHAWVSDSVADQPADPRLPFGSTTREQTR